MIRLLRFSATMLLVCSMCQVAPLAAQEPAHLTLGLDKATAGDPVFIPVAFTAPPDMAMGRLVLEVRFPSSDLSFIEARSALSEEEAGYSLTAEVKSQEADSSLLKMTFESKKVEEIAGGVLAFLTFQLSTDVPPGKVILLESQARGFALGEPSEDLAVIATDGEIEVVEVPVLFSCFFYMH